MYDAMAYLWMIPVIPIIAGFVTFIIGPSLLRSQAHLPCIIAGLISFVLSLIVLNDVVKAVESNDISNPSSVSYNNPVFCSINTIFPDGPITTKSISPNIA